MVGITHNKEEYLIMCVYMLSATNTISQDIVGENNNNTIYTAKPN
jgi:hypothetical protein